MTVLYTHIFSRLLFIISGCEILVAPVAAGEDQAETGKYIDSAVPDSWYEAPKTASELGIEEFHQSPMLDKSVANGKLPPVEERLPDDPLSRMKMNRRGRYRVGNRLDISRDSYKVKKVSVTYSVKIPQKIRLKD